jgi:hypothetical protein
MEMLLIIAAQQKHNPILSKRLSTSRVEFPFREVSVAHHQNEAASQKEAANKGRFRLGFASRRQSPSMRAGCFAGAAS